jgi:formylglycine-generating enzyme required for sulfatase activity
MGIRILFLVLVILVSGSTMILADNFLIIHTDDGETRVNLAEIDRITFASMEQEERDFPLTDDMSKTMVWIPSGEFDMGSPDNEEGRANNEGPVHRVLLEYRFWMGKFEITQAQWEAVTGDNPL